MDFISVEHQTIGNEIKFPKGQISLKRKDPKSSGPKTVVYPTTRPHLHGNFDVVGLKSREHKEVGDMISTELKGSIPMFDTPLQEATESTSGEHKTIGDMATPVNLTRHRDKVTYNTDEHQEIGNMIKLPVGRLSEFMSHEHQEFGNRVELPAQDMMEYNTGKRQANGYAIKFKKESKSRKVKGLTENFEKTTKIDHENRKENEKVGDDFVDGCKEVGKGVMRLEFIV